MKDMIFFFIAFAVAGLTFALLARRRDAACLP